MTSNNLIPGRVKGSPIFTENSPGGCTLSILDVWGLAIALGVLMADVIDRAQVWLAFINYIAPIATIDTLRVRVVFFIVNTIVITLIAQHIYVWWWCRTTLISAKCDDAIIRFLSSILIAFCVEKEISFKELVSKGLNAGLDERLVKYLLKMLQRGAYLKKTWGYKDAKDKAYQ